MQLATAWQVPRFTSSSKSRSFAFEYGSVQTLSNSFPSWAERTFAMPPSQLKRLKASLQAAGVIGNQKSKKEKKKNARAGSDARVDKHSKLQSIREEFNPFEVKTTRVKYDVSGRTKIKGVQGRPGISKQIGEETVSVPWLKSVFWSNGIAHIHLTVEEKNAAC